MELLELNEEIEGVWNSWNSTCEVAVIMDGKKLNDVFTAIKQQLEYLRRQHVGMNQKFEQLVQNQHKQNVAHAHDPLCNLLDDILPTTAPIHHHESHDTNHNHIHNNVENNNANHNQHDDSNNQSAYASAKLAQMAPPAPVVEQVLDAEELQIILDRIHALEQDVRRHDTYGDRLDKLEASVNSKFAMFQAQMDKLNARVDATSAMEMMFEKRFADLEDNFNARFQQLSQAFEDKNALTQRQAQDSLADQKAELNELKELIQINELRIKKAEGDIVRTEHAVNDVQETVDYFPVKYLDGIRNDIIELYTIKAGKDELHNKADVALAQSKADLDEVHRLEQHTLELLRRLDLHAKEMHDGFSSVDGKLDKRIDKVAHWCLKHLRKEFKNNGSGGNDDRDGADIGRVKCLVCDQVIVQHTETEIVHGGPPMKNVIQPYHAQKGHPMQNTQYHPQYNQHAAPAPGHGHTHATQRPRSASPPPSRGRGNGTGSAANTQQYGERFQPGYTYGATDNTATVTMPKIKATTIINPNPAMSTNPAKTVKLARIPGTESPPTTSPASPGTGVQGGSVTHPASNGNVDFNEEVEHGEDFNYRVETDVGHHAANANPTATPASIRAHAAPVVQEGPMRIQLAQMHGSGNQHASMQPNPALTSSATQAILQQQMLQLNVQQDGNYYFKDLEE